MDLVEIFLRLLDEHSFTQKMVCKTIGYSSPNQLTRVLRREVSTNYMVDFGMRLLSCAKDLCLTAEEQREIQACITNLGIGWENLSSYGRLWSLIQNPQLLPSDDPAPTVRLISPSGQVVGTIKTVFRDASRVHIKATAGCRSALLQSLKSIETDCALSVDLYYEEGMGPVHAVDMLEAAWPMLHKPWFRPWSVRFAPGKSHSGLLETNMMMIDAFFLSECGEQKRGSMLIPIDDSRALHVALPEAHQAATSLLFPPQNAAAVFPMKSNVTSFGSYLDYLCYISDLEYNHRVFRMKRDIGLEMISADIQQAALREGPMGDRVIGTALEQELYDVQHRRYRNSLEKRKHQYHLLSFSALRKFAQTGVESDHFWGFRPFTPTERLRILEELYIRASAHHYFHLMFIRQEQDFIPDEIVWYEGRGVCFLLPGTEYRMDDQHSEMLFTDPDFAAFFSTVFRQRLCSSCAYSYEESAALLMRIIDELKAQIKHTQEL